MFRRLGVRGRLLLAFFGISAFAVLAAAAAMYSFSEFGKVLGRITQERVPSTLASLELSRQAERIVAAAPSLLTVATSTQHEEQSSRIAGEVAHLSELLSDLRGSAADASDLDPIESAVEQLRTNLGSLDVLVADRLAVSEQKTQLLQALSANHAAVQRLLTPWVLVTESRISQLRGSTGDTGLSDDQRQDALMGLVEAKDARERFQQAQLEGSVINDTLRQTASARQADRIPILVFQLRRQIDNLKELAADFDPKLHALLATRVEEFRNFAEGSGSLPEVREREIELAAAGGRLVQENAELARRLTEAVDRLVHAANQDIKRANLEVLSMQRLSSGILVAVVASSLVSSALIVWLYVGRNVIARLTALSNSMLAIAGGNLRAQLPQTGNDEIGRMAEALTVFRDTAVEVEEKNLREIAEARRRLIDAIESISEGFAFYDSEDHLVLSNRRYRELLYPGVKDAVKPGMPFSAIIRNAAERGLVRDAEGRIEEWIGERLNRHREPTGSFIQRRGDGRWIEVTEHKISEGGTVAIYTDITEQKQSELALLEEKRRTEEANEQVIEKNRMLESLSAKLSKYLSPQVYSSIFSGQQSVEISSKRKKLTVFFSDIAGFTETADDLESEELTGLLNNYLTEMSKIALEYGATIDKYIGDAVMLFFGDPETRGVKEDAVACVEMAIAMQRRMRELQTQWRDTGLESPFQLRIGINTGYCTVGNFGSEDRMDYTIVGNEVNLAARLQVHAELGGILMAHETFSLVKDTVSAEEGSPITLKGFAKPVRNYKVIDIDDDPGAQRRILHKEDDGMRLHVDLNKQDKASAIKAIEEFLSEIKR